MSLVALKTLPSDLNDFLNLEPAPRHVRRVRHAQGELTRGPLFCFPRLARLHLTPLYPARRFPY